MDGICNNYALLMVRCICILPPRRGEICSQALFTSPPKYYKLHHNVTIHTKELYDSTLYYEGQQSVLHCQVFFNIFTKTGHVIKDIQLLNEVEYEISRIILIGVKVTCRSGTEATCTWYTTFSSVFAFIQTLYG